MPMSHSGRLHLTCNQDPKGHVGSNPIIGSSGVCSCIRSPLKKSNSILAMWPSGLGKGLQNLLDWFDSNGRLKVNKRTHRWQQRKFATVNPNVEVLLNVIPRKQQPKQFESVGFSMRTG